MSAFLPITERDERGAQQNLSVLAPAAVPPTGFGDNVEASWHAMLFENLAVSDELALEAGWGYYLDEVEKRTGEKLKNPARVYSTGLGFDGPGDMVGGAVESLLDVNWGLSRHSRYDTEVAETRAKLEALKARHPDLDVKGHDDIIEHISRVSKAVRDETALVRAGADGWGDLGAFVGGAGAAVLDPPNLATILVGAPAGAKLLHTFLVEAGLGAGVELATLPSRADWKEQIGSDYGAGDMATDVTLGAVGAGGLGVGVRLLGRGIGGVSDAWRAARQAGTVLDTLETRAAEQVVDAARDITEQSPFEDSIEGHAAHLRGMADAEEAFMRGELPEGRALEEYHAHQRKSISELVDWTLENASGRVGRDKPQGVWYGRFTPGRADDVAEAIRKGTKRNLDLTNAVHRLDEDGISHAMNRHGDDRIPLEREDLQNIPDVMRTGQIVGATLTDQKLPGVTYRKLINGRWLYAVEEAHGASKKAPTMALKTAYWKYGPKNKSGAEAPEFAAPERYADGKPFSVVRAGQPLHVPDPQKRPLADVQNDHAGPATFNIADAANVRKGGLPPLLREPKKKPQRLLDWVRKASGLKDQDGELRHMGITSKSRPGVINNKSGMNYDDAALHAWESGFLAHNGAARPSINEFLDALRSDFDGTHPQYSSADINLKLEWDEYTARWAEVDRMGIDPRGMTDGQLQDAMAARWRIPPTPTEARATIEELDAMRPAQDQALYRNVQRIVEDDPDHPIHFEEPNPDGTVTTGATSVRDFMDAADDDIRAVEAFRVCALVGKGQ